MNHRYFAYIFNFFFLFLFYCNHVTTIKRENCRVPRSRKFSVCNRHRLQPIAAHSIQISMYSKHDTQSVHALCYVYIRAYIYISRKKEKKKDTYQEWRDSYRKRCREKGREREREDVSIQTTWPRLLPVFGKHHPLLCSPVNRHILFFPIFTNRIFGN